MKNRRLLLMALALLALVIISQFFFIVQPGQVVVVTRQGTPVGKPVDKGLGFKVPFMDQLVRLDKRLITTNIAKLRIVTPKGVNLTTTASVVWHMHNPLAFVANKYTEENVAEELASVSADLIQQILSNYSEAESTVQKAEMEETLLVEINRKVKLKGLIADKFSTSRLEPADTSGLLLKMRESWQKYAQEILSQGQAEAARIKFEVEEKRAEIVARSLKKCISVKARGEAKAVKILGQAFSAAPKEFQDIFTKCELKRLSSRMIQD